MDATVVPVESRFVSRLNDEILRAETPERAACLRAERAGVLARLGQVEAARSELEIIAGICASRPTARLSILLNIGRGILNYYCNSVPEARNWFLRAVAISRASEHAASKSLPLAWLAYVEFEADNMESMADALAESLRFAEEDDFHARSRVSIVASIAYYYVGMRERALEWQGRARSYAAKLGDESVHASLLANLAGFEISRLRFQEVFGVLDSEDLNWAQGLAASSVNFDEVIGLESLSYLNSALKAELLARQGKYVRALEVYVNSWDEIVRSTGNRRESYMLADMAWCSLRHGESEKARLLARKAEASLISVTHTDDRAVINGQLASIFRELGMEGISISYSRDARELYSKVEEDRELLAKRLDLLLSF